MWVTKKIKMKNTNTIFNIGPPLWKSDSRKIHQCYHISRSLPLYIYHCTLRYTTHFIFYKYINIFNSHRITCLFALTCCCWFIFAINDPCYYATLIQIQYCLLAAVIMVFFSKNNTLNFFLLIWNTKKQLIWHKSKPFLVKLSDPFSSHTTNQSIVTLPKGIEMYINNDSMLKMDLKHDSDIIRPSK